MARRKRTPESNALVASAQRVKVNDAKAVKAALRTPAQWQSDAWAFFDEVPEIKFSMLYVGAQMAKVEFFAATLDEDGEVVRVNDERSPLVGSQVAVQAEFEMARLRSERGGLGEITKHMTINLDVAGECYLHGRAERQRVDPKTGETIVVPEQWDIRSRDEIEVKRDTDAQGRPVVWVKTDPEAKGDPDGETIIVHDPDLDTLIRVWTRHPRYSALADSHMRGLLSDLETLVLLTSTIKAEAKSRMTAPIVTLPRELTFQAPPGAPSGGGTGDPFSDAIAQTYASAIEDPSDVASVAPMLLRGPADYLKPEYVRVISLARVTDASTDQRIKDRIDRVARGLNLPVEKVMGHMSTTYANAEQIDQDEFDDHFETRCMTACDVYESAFLRPQLAEAGIEPQLVDRVFVWFDASRLVNDTAVGATADALYDRGVISEAAYRRMRGVTEDDAPDEQARWRALAERKGNFTADLTAAMFRMAGVPIPELPKAETADSADLNPEVVSPEMAMILLRALVAAASGEGLGDVGPKAPSVIEASARAIAPTEGLGRRLAEIDRDLRSRLIGAAEAAMERALERAGARVKGKRGTEASLAVRHVPPRDACRVAGRALVAAAGFTDDELLDGAWSTLEGQFRTWVNAAGDEALTQVSSAVRGGMKPATMTAYKLRQVENTDEAWRWFSDTMTAVGRDRLYGSAIEATAGEHDPSAKVPASAVRQALAVAGGETGFKASPAVGGTGYGASVMVPTNARPIGGVATGALVDDAMAEHGLTVEGYVWVYGPAARRTFEPHAALDGVFFENFDDDVLTNDEDWPDTPYFYPGDHEGCVCDFEPEVRERPAAPLTRAAVAPTAPELSAPDDWLDAAERAERDETLADEVPRAVDFFRRTDAAVDAMSKEQQWALFNYQMENFQVMNGAVRSAARSGEPLTGDARRLVTALDSAFKEHGTPMGTAADRPLWRGVGAEELTQLKALKPGDRFVTDGYLSTSISKEVAGEFMSDGMVKVTVLPSTRVLPGSWSEAEVVIHRATEWVFEGFTQRGDPMIRWKGNHVAS